jgi:hypothetical protein
MNDHFVDKIFVIEHHDGWGFRLKPSPIGPEWVSIAIRLNPENEYDPEGLGISPAMARDLAKALNEMADFCESLTKA